MFRQPFHTEPVDVALTHLLLDEPFGQATLRMLCHIGDVLNKVTGTAPDSDNGAAIPAMLSPGAWQVTEVDRRAPNIKLENLHPTPELDNGLGAPG